MPVIVAPLSGNVTGFIKPKEDLVELDTNHRLARDLQVAALIGDEIPAANKIVKNYAYPSGTNGAQPVTGSVDSNGAQLSQQADEFGTFWKCTSTSSFLNFTIALGTVGDWSFGGWVTRDQTNSSTQVFNFEKGGGGNWDDSIAMGAQSGSNRREFRAGRSYGGSSYNTGYVNPAYAANEWVHVVATYTSNTAVRLYVNGTFRTSGSGSIANRDQCNVFRCIGRYVSCRSIMFANRIWSDDEIWEQYARPYSMYKYKEQPEILSFPEPAAQTISILSANMPQPGFGW